MPKHPEGKNCDAAKFRCPAQHRYQNTRRGKTPTHPKLPTNSRPVVDKWLEGKSGSAPYGPTGSGKAGGGGKGGGKDVGRPSTAAPAAPELSAPPPKAAAFVPPPLPGGPPPGVIAVKAPPAYLQPQQQQPGAWPYPNLSGLQARGIWPPQHPVVSHQPPVNYPPPATYQQAPPGYFQQQQPQPQPGYYQQLQPAEQQPPQSSAASSSWGGYQQPQASDVQVQRQPSAWEEVEVDPAVIAKAAWG